MSVVSKNTSTSEQIKGNIFDEISDWAKNEFKHIRREKTFNKNMSFAFTDLGDTGELFTLILYPDSIGSSSKGGCAFDNKEYNEDYTFKITREVKFLSLDGSKICKTCESLNKTNGTKRETKVPRFQPKCLFCKESNFYIPKDSRWGISAKAHKDYCNDTYKLNEYILFLSEFDETNNCINLKCYKIFSSNKYFSDYIENQYENGKGNTCNFQPNSWDFYLSGPSKLFDINIDENGIISEVFFDLDNKKIMNVPKSIIKKNKQYCSYSEFIPEDGLEYSSIIGFCERKKKALGKKRGTVSRK
jgi:hypothetical protein